MLCWNSELIVHGPPRRFVTHGQDESLAELHETRFRNTSFRATYHELFTLFGAPLERPGPEITTEWGLRFDDGVQAWVVDSDYQYPGDEEPPSGPELRNESDETLRRWLILADPGVPAISRVQSALFAHRMALRGVDATAMGPKEGIFQAVGVAFGNAMRLPVPAAGLLTPGGGITGESPGAATPTAGAGDDPHAAGTAADLPCTPLPPAIAAAVAKWKPLRFHTHNEDASLAARRGSLQAYLVIEGPMLQYVFGPPIRHEGVHITLEWGVRFEDGSCVWIHDWDATNRANPERPKPESLLNPGRVFNSISWHVVGEALRPAQKLRRTLRALYQLCSRASGHDPNPVNISVPSTGSSDDSGAGAAGSSGPGGTVLERPAS